MLNKGHLVTATGHSMQIVSSLQNKGAHLIGFVGERRGDSEHRDHQTFKTWWGKQTSGNWANITKKSSPAPTQQQSTGDLHLLGALVLACGDVRSPVCPCDSRIPALSDWPHLPRWLSFCHDAVCPGDCCLVSMAVCSGGCLVTVALSALSGGFCLVMLALSSF